MLFKSLQKTYKGKNSSDNPQAYFAGEIQAKYALLENERLLPG